VRMTRYLVHGAREWVHLPEGWTEPHCIAKQA
jgi:hypothetical protein